VNGEALIDFSIGPDGVPTDLKVVSATAPEFGEAALICVSKWRFRPAFVDGRAISSRMQIPIVFQAR
jgi:TonB family protein